MAKKKRVNPSDKKGRREEINRIFSEFAEELKKDPEFMRMFHERIRETQAMSLPDITQSDWQETNPAGITTGGDRFYAVLATKLQKEFVKLNIDPNLPKGLFRYASMSLCAYLEDLVCQWGVWDTVKEICKERYGNYIPFYPTVHDDYFTDDLNIEDVEFIIWQAFVRTGQADGRIFSPYSEAVTVMAKNALDVLADSFEKAPRPARVDDAIKRCFKNCDFFELRSLGLWLAVDFPLTAVPFMREQILEDAEELYDLFTSKGVYDLGPEENYYNVECSFGWIQHCSMASVPNWEILARMARKRGFENAAELLAGIKVRKFDNYAVEALDGGDVLLTSLQGDEFILSADSFPAKRDFTGIKGMMVSIVKFGDKWIQNGMSSSFTTAPDVTDNGISELLQPNERTKEYFREIIREHDGRRVFYCRSTKDVAKIMGVGEPQPMDKDMGKPKNLLLMISEDSLPEIEANVCEMFYDSTNKFFKPGFDSDGMEALRFITHGTVPEDVANYICDHNLLPSAKMYASQGEKVGRAIIQNNMLFFFCFYRVKASSANPYQDKDDADGEYENEDH